MSTCFIIQPFDGDKYDKRYESVYAPAIRNAKLDPYRVDRDSSVTIPIQEIENGIKNSVLCFADITEDNPNVWFELGYAIGVQRDVILVCSKERTTRFPFDVQHRNIINYSATAPQDFEELKLKITDKVIAMLKKNTEISYISSVQLINETQGLQTHEIVALAAILQNSILSDGYSSGYSIKNDMNANGFTDAAFGIAIKSLLAKDFIRGTFQNDRNGEQYSVFATTEKGDTWLIANQDKLKLKSDRAPNAFDDIPF
jgi:hypothetical protein